MSDEEKRDIPSDREVFEELVDEACDWDRETNGEADEEIQRKVHAKICEEIDAKKREAKHKYKVGTELSPNTNKLPKGVYVKERHLDEITLLARQRLQKLLKLPEWRKKFNCINPGAASGALGLKAVAEVDKYVRDLINSSSKIFGDWRKEVLVIDMDSNLIYSVPTRLR